MIPQRLIPVGHPNRPGTKLSDLRAICIHYTGNDAPSMGADANIRYMGRQYSTDPSGKYLESDGKSPFSYGSAHVFCDMSGSVQAIPFDEVAWSVGDRRFQPSADHPLGQQLIAHRVFGNRQNYHSISIEICNNDAIKNSDADWHGAVENAIKVVSDFCTSKKLSILTDGSLDPQIVTGPPPAGSIYILRHFDVTGKQCPLPMVLHPEKWVSFVEKTAKKVNEG